MKTVSRTEIYNAALEQLRIADEAMDQAHAMLKDLGLDDYVETGYGPRRQNARSLSLAVSGLLEDLRDVKCPDCGEPLSGNEACLANRCPSLTEVAQ
jgi:hypothetical protein